MASESPAGAFAAITGATSTWPALQAQQAQSDSSSGNWQDLQPPICVRWRGWDGWGSVCSPGGGCVLKDFDHMEDQLHMEFVAAVRGGSEVGKHPPPTSYPSVGLMGWG